MGIFISCNQASDAQIEVTESTQNLQSTQLPEENIVSFEQLKKQVLEPLSSTMCHGAMRQEAGLLKYLEEGEPFSSKVYLRMEDGTMPPRGNTATKEQLEILENYISDLQAQLKLDDLSKNLAVKCEYEEGSCMYYIKCRRQWPPVGCS